MQNIIKVFFVCIGLFLFSSVELFASNSVENQLLQADQLFAKKKFTEAYTIYHSLYKNHKKYTPQTLLKMAYINEALGDNTHALYFLNTFYENFPDKRIFTKMKEIAEKEKLEGYYYSDLEFFANIYRNYRDELLMGLVALVFVYFLAVVTNKFFIKGISNTSPITFIAFVLLVGYGINFCEVYINPAKYICTQNNPLVMQDPSAGSKCIGQLSKGTRVSVVGEHDIWYQIKYGNTKGYIRKFNLQL